MERERKGFAEISWARAKANSYVYTFDIFHIKF